MDTDKYLRKRLSTIFWACLLIWWGLRWSLLVGLPEGSGLLGTGILLLGATVVIKAARMEPKPDTTFFGLITLISGVALVIMSVSHQSAPLPVFETILVAAGVALLISALTSKKKIEAGQS